MFHKAVFFVGHKVITVSGNCGGRSGQNILHRHSHTVDDGTIHVRSAAFQGLVHSLCRGTDGETVFRKAPKGALTIYLHKIDSVRVKLFIPVPVESFPRQRWGMIFPSAVRYRWACSCPSSLLSGATPCQYPQSACHTPNQRMSLSALISAIIFPKPLGNLQAPEQNRKAALLW